jgi:hypothetical protein
VLCTAVQLQTGSLQDGQMILTLSGVDEAELAIELLSNNTELRMRSFGTQRVLLLPPAARFP